MLWRGVPGMQVLPCPVAPAVNYVSNPMLCIVAAAMIVDGEKQQEERMEVETAALEEEEYSVSSQFSSLLSGTKGNLLSAAR